MSDIFLRSIKVLSKRKTEPKIVIITATCRKLIPRDLIVSRCWKFNTQNEEKYEGVSESYRVETITKYTLATINNHWETNTKCYGDKTHQTDSQNSDKTAPSGRELYHLQFSIQEASPETSGYTLVWPRCNEIEHLAPPGPAETKIRTPNSLHGAEFF
jgi:hypothetical protein